MTYMYILWDTTQKLIAYLMHVDFQWTRLYIHDESESAAARHVETEISGNAYTKNIRFNWNICLQYNNAASLQLTYNKLFLTSVKGVHTTAEIWNAKSTCKCWVSLTTSCTHTAKLVKGKGKLSLQEARRLVVRLSAWRAFRTLPQEAYKIKILTKISCTNKLKQKCTDKEQVN
jgi:hypothetical protein